MDSRLHAKLQKWHDQIETLEGIERTCLSLESEENPLYSSLFLAAGGKNNAEREAAAYTSSEWRTFQGGLVEAKVRYNRARRELELKQSAFQAEYLQAKSESGAIQRLPKEIA